jgi:hypothetical protein
MQPTEEFTGLGMPVFTAFGWAGEEAAQNYALSQLEQFAAVLQANLPVDLKNELPFHGLSVADRSAYLAAEEDVESDVHVTFNARPTSLETQMALTDKVALARAFKQLTKNPASVLILLQHLGPEWSLRVQQMQVDEEAGDQGHYQDLFKGDIAELNEESLAEIIDKAAYLNGEDQWVTPLYLGQRLPAEQASAMGLSIIPVMAERMQVLTPLITVLRGRVAKKQTAPATAKGETKAKSVPSDPVVVPEQPDRPLSQEEFVYISELKPLHVRRGFVNMTPEYWPFFAATARMESRPVTVILPDGRREEGAVWRLQPDDLARLVLGPRAHRWLEETFVAGSYIQMVVTKLEESNIQVVLEPLS